MIKVILTKKDDNVNKVIINGHAGYDDFGKDIVDTGMQFEQGMAKILYVLQCLVRL